MKFQIGKTNVIGDETETDPAVFSNVKIQGVLATACQVVESAATLLCTANNCNVTGSVAIEKISKTDFYTGGVVHLLFVDGVQIKHLGGGTGQIHLRDGTDYTAPAGTIMIFGLFFNSVVSEWYEISRSEPGV